MRLLILLAVLGLSACAAVPTKEIDWHVWTENAVAEGKMLDKRTDPDSGPLTPQVLSENFDKIGFSFERRTIGVRNRTGDRHKVIRKWQRPLEYAVFSTALSSGRIEPPFQQFMERLAEITGHDMRAAERSGAELMKWRSVENLDGRMILMFGSDAFFQDILRGRIAAPDTVRAFVDRWRPSASPCAGFVRHGSPSQPFTGPLSSVVIAIREEVPTRLLQACIEEEFAQSMGLFNDDPSVTPSLFNDDQRYGVLTEHDELLLRILYDARLRHGMPRAMAMPIVRRIAAELLSGA